MRILAIFVILICGLNAANIQHQTVNDQTVLDTNRLNGLLGIWQKELNLSSWSIVLQVVRERGLPKGTVGIVRWCKEKHTATIKILDRLDYTRPKISISFDQEMTLAHELVHILRIEMPESKDEEKEVERHARIFLEKFYAHNEPTILTVSLAAK